MRQPSGVDGWEGAEREGRVALQEEQAFRCEIAWEEEEWVTITFDLSDRVELHTQEVQRCPQGDLQLALPSGHLSEMPWEQSVRYGGFRGDLTRAVDKRVTRKYGGIIEIVDKWKDMVTWGAGR